MTTKGHTMQKEVGIAFIFQTCSSNISAQIPKGFTILGPPGAWQRSKHFRHATFFTRLANSGRRLRRQLLVIGLVKLQLLALIVRRTFLFERLQTFQPVFGWDHLGDNRVAYIRGTLKLCFLRAKYSGFLSDLGQRSLSSWRALCQHLKWLIHRLII